MPAREVEEEHAEKGISPQARAIGLINGVEGAIERPQLTVEHECLQFWPGEDIRSESRGQRVSHVTSVTECAP